MMTDDRPTSRTGLQRARWLAALAAAVFSVSFAWAQVAAPGTGNAPEYSAAERLLFMTDQLSALPSPARLNYTFRKSGSLESGFDDRVTVDVRKSADGACCLASTSFLSGSHRMQMPDLEGATGNPVLLYFLEHDVRDMLRLTKGAPAYFRKRIRMALAEGATLRDVALTYGGGTRPGKLVEIHPYVNDPTRQRYARFARKSYQFYLSDAVPGMVYGLRTVVHGDGERAQPLLIEELCVEGGRLPETLPVLPNPTM